MASQIVLNVDEKFEHLSNPPIVEAVIDIRGRAQGQWDESHATASIPKQLPDFVESKAIRKFEFQAPALPIAPPSGSAPPLSGNYRDEWIGLRLTSGDSRNVAMFTRDFFSFSRLQPYQKWESFEGQAMQLWSVHHSIAHVAEVQRVGVRFINRIQIPADTANVSRFFRGFGTPPGNLPSNGFIYTDRLVLEGYPHQANVVRTVQPPSPGSANSAALILDIDAFFPKPFAATLQAIHDRLAELHWLKNRVFFGTVTEEVLKLHR